MCTHMEIHFSILNGYVNVISGIESDEERLENFDDIRIPSNLQNKTAYVNCNEGFVVDNPNENVLICNQGEWEIIKNGSIYTENFVGIHVHQKLPKCREVVCKKDPLILNARMLKKVSFKFFWFHHNGVKYGYILLP